MELPAAECVQTLEYQTAMLLDIIRVSDERRATRERDHRREMKRLERLAAVARSRLHATRAQLVECEPQLPCFM